MPDHIPNNGLDNSSVDSPESRQNLHVTELHNALASPDVPELYANSFTVTMGTGDVLVLMKRNHKNVGILQMSYTVAKSLAQTLDEMISILETRTGNEIMTSKFIELKMQEYESNDSAG